LGPGVYHFTPLGFFVKQTKCRVSCPRATPLYNHFDSTLDEGGPGGTGGVFYFFPPSFPTVCPPQAVYGWRWVNDKSDNFPLSRSFRRGFFVVTHCLFFFFLGPENGWGLFLLLGGTQPRNKTTFTPLPCLGVGGGGPPGLVWCGECGGGLCAPPQSSMCPLGTCVLF